MCEGQRRPRLALAKKMSLKYFVAACSYAKQKVKKDHRRRSMRDIFWGFLNWKIRGKEVGKTRTADSANGEHERAHCLSGAGGKFKALVYMQPNLLEYMA